MNVYVVVARNVKPWLVPVSDVSRNLRLSFRYLLGSRVVGSACPTACSCAALGAQKQILGGYFAGPRKLLLGLGRHGILR